MLAEFALSLVLGVALTLALIGLIALMRRDRD